MARMSAGVPGVVVLAIVRLPVSGLVLRPNAGTLTGKSLNYQESFLSRWKRSAAEASALVRESTLPVAPSHSHRGAEDEAQGGRRRSGTEADGQLTQGALARRGPGQHADSGARAEQRQPAQPGGPPDGYPPLRTEQVGQHRDRGTGGEEAEAGQGGAH